MCCEKYLNRAYPGTVLTGGRRHLNEGWLLLEWLLKAWFLPSPFKSSLSPHLLCCFVDIHIILTLNSLHSKAVISLNTPPEGPRNLTCICCLSPPQIHFPMSTMYPSISPLSVPIVASEILPTSFPFAWIPWRSAVSVDYLLQTFF